MISVLQSTYFAGAGTAMFTAAFSEFAPVPFTTSLTCDFKYPVTGLLGNMPDTGAQETSQDEYSSAAIAADALSRMAESRKTAQGAQRFFAAAFDPARRSSIEAPASSDRSSQGNNPAGESPASEKAISKSTAVSKFADKQIKERILAGLKKNPSTLKKLVQLSGLNSEKRLLRYCRIYAIQLPEGFYEPESRSNMDGTRREKLVAMVAAGRTLEQMRVPLGGVSYQRVQLMLKKEGLNAPRMARRHEFKLARKEQATKLRAERQAFVDFLRRLEEVRAKDSPWIEVQIWKYRLKHPMLRPGSVFYEKLRKLFEAYLLAMFKGEKRSLYELGEKSGIYFTSITKILRDVGLDRMYRNLDRHVTPKWKKEAIVKAFLFSPLSAGDIARFLELPRHVVQGTLNCRGHRVVRKAPILRGGRGKKWLTYYPASQVYEAQDVGLTPEETGYRLNLSLDRVRYLLENRHQFGPVITKALRVMYPEEGINTPYRWKEKS